MDDSLAHSWNVKPEEARRIQRDLADRVVAADDFGTIRRVAGIDVGFDLKRGLARAAVAVLDFPGLGLIDRATAKLPVTFPYVPGLLSFREAPVVLAALERLKIMPDLLLCDGQGIAHPRRFGIACHVGVLTDTPAIGVAKTRLTGRHAPLPETKGSRVALLDGKEEIGVVLRSRDRVKPLYVSIGHRIGLESAVTFTLACLTRYRLPETTRWAHKLAGEKRVNKGGGS